MFGETHFEIECLFFLGCSRLHRPKSMQQMTLKNTIHVPDADNLATNLMEMKRSSSYEWHRSCDQNDAETLHLPPGILLANDYLCRNQLGKF